MPAAIAIPTSTTNAAWFEQQYQRAGDHLEQLPWPTGLPSDALVNWLNAVAPSLIRCGARVCVIGCGLGDDARELMRRGYEVTAFDCCALAVSKAQQADPEHASCYVQADLFHPPLRWRHRFDLVVEANNLCWWNQEMRDAAVSAIADMLSMHGRLLIISPAVEHDLDGYDGPPWPLTERDLTESTALAGLVPDRPISMFTDESSPTGSRLRASFHRA
jgi:SAM-dependent methyltransferase